MIVDRTGDLFTLLAATSPAQVAVAHGVNCRGVMGAGIAATFAATYPGLADAHRAACRTKTLRVGGCLPWQSPADHRWVYNCASQDRPGRHATIDAVARSVTAACQHAAAVGLDGILLPRIGAGIGGLAWPAVRATLQQVADAHPTVHLGVVTLPAR